MDKETIEQHVSTGNWDKLGLPFPSEMLHTLLMKGKIWLKDHTLHYEKETPGVTWYTNPSGTRGVFLFGMPDVDHIEEFMSDMLRGKVYGPANAQMDIASESI